MGTNKRYAHSIDAKTVSRILQSIMRTAEPETLSDTEKNLGSDPLTRPPQPRPARAWVRYGQQAVQIDVELVAWTDRVAAIKWASPDTIEHHAWVWASATQTRDPTSGSY
jgi:hypothetical protein